MLYILYRLGTGQGADDVMDAARTSMTEHGKTRKLTPDLVGVVLVVEVLHEDLTYADNVLKNKRRPKKKISHHCPIIAESRNHLANP